MSHIARHIRITGRVQGVFFRAWTREQADNLGISGWVRNRTDGSVEAHLQGEQWAVQRLIELLHRGPAAGVVVDNADFERIERFEARQ